MYAWMGLDAIHVHTRDYKTEMILQKCVASNVEPDQGSTTAVLQSCRPSELSPVVWGHETTERYEQMSSALGSEKTVAEENADSGPKHYRGATPAAQKRIRTEVVSEYRGRVAALVRRRLNRELWTEGEHVGLIGVLVALERYEPQKNDCFWAFASLWVRKELQRWLDRGVYWRPAVSKRRSNKDDTAEAEARAHRQPASLDAPQAPNAADTLHDLIPSDVVGPEDLVSNAELKVRLRRFVATLHPDDVNILFSENLRNRKTRRYLVLTRRAARALVRGPDAPHVRVKNADSTAAPGSKPKNKTR